MSCSVTDSKKYVILSFVQLGRTGVDSSWLSYHSFTYRTLETTHVGTEFYPGVCPCGVRIIFVFVSAVLESPSCGGGNHLIFSK